MRIYFSGIGGVGIGPLAEIAHDMGHDIIGSDLTEGLVTDELRRKGISFAIGQDGSFLRAVHQEQPIDWFVYTAALPADHPELVLAKSLGIRTAKRDELLAHLIKEKGLKLIAVTGTHGKTTTTGMLVWTLQQLEVPVSYSVGTTLSFSPSGHYDPASQYFIYECDEYDRNFLHFFPDVAIITSVDYDHPDSFPTEADYKAAFLQFVSQSTQTIAWQKDADYVGVLPTGTQWLLKESEVASLHLAGAHNRRNASLVLKAIEFLQAGDSAAAVTAIEQFPGTDRRFEKLAENLYSDYGHHPQEIAATLQMARELSDRVVLVYQPHQNRRQHELRDQYQDCLALADTTYWLPTYLSREDPSQTILTPQELINGLSNRGSVTAAELDDALWSKIQAARQSGALVLCMGAGTIDQWLRQRLAA